MTTCELNEPNEPNEPNKLKKPAASDQHQVSSIQPERLIIHWTRRAEKHVKFHHP